MQLKLFSAKDGVTLDVIRFYQSNLGALYEALPIKVLAKDIELQLSGMGRCPILSVAGKIGLCVLKHYWKMSDAQLVEQLNTNPIARLFCDLPAHYPHWIKDEDLPSRTRLWLSEYLNWDKVEKHLMSFWEEDLEDTQVAMMDATCYESHVAYPTDVKLLWKACEWIERRKKALCKALRLRCPRSKFKDIKNAFLSYSKLRKKSRKKEKRVRKRLLNLLEKLLGQLDHLLRLESSTQNWKPNWWQRLETIKTVFEQQKYHYNNPNPKDKSIPDRIVSLHKPYLRPIVRGKETKRVEFGLKVNMIQIDGINFIEHISPKAFHEGNRLQNSVLKHLQLARRCSHLGADKIYATNKNRKWLSSKGIFTNFLPKGKKAKDEPVRKQMRSILDKVRSTRLEGSFGTEKEHYHLKKIKARTLATEIIWIRFGILTANAMRIVRRRKKTAA